MSGAGWTEQGARDMLKDADSHPTTALGAAKDAPHPPAAASGDDDDRLLALMEQWEERFRRDGDAAPEALDVGDPALMEALRERIEIGRAHV